MNKAEAIHEYVKTGFTLLKIRSFGKGKGKAPIEADWSTKEYAPDIKPSDFPHNYGVLLTKQDLVIDVDPRNFPQDLDRHPAKELEQFLKVDFTEFYSVKTGGGGFHIYMQIPEEYRNKTICNELAAYPGIEFKSFGRQVVGPGSVHPVTGKEYVTIKFSPKHARAKQAPNALLDLITKKPAALTTRKADVEDDSETNLARTVQALAQYGPAVEGSSGDQHTYNAACICRDHGLSEQAAFEVMFVWNETCLPPWNIVELNLKIQNAYKYGQEAQGSKNAQSEFPVVEYDSGETLEGFAAWDMNKKGELVPTPRNTHQLVFADPTVDIIFDEFSGVTKLISPAPWDKREKLGPNGREWIDADTLYLRIYLNRKHNYVVTTNQLHEAVETVARENKNHPVRNYLKSLKWDGVPRIDTWMMKYLGAADNEYVREVGAKTLIACAARIFDPGCKLDTILILEGAQGTGKSTAIRILGGDWYADPHLDIKNKDAVDQLKGVWICEMAEFECGTKAETETLKAFITRQVDRVRPAYARRTENFPRQCVFIGTINPEAKNEYLKDQTGGRRFWPVETSKIELDKITKDRDQIWAEAVVRYKTGSVLHLEHIEARRIAELEQKARSFNDLRTEAVIQFLKDYEEEYITPMDLWAQVFGRTPASFGRREQRDVAELMRQAGYGQTLPLRDGSHVTRVYKVKGD